MHSSASLEFPRFAQLIFANAACQCLREQLPTLITSGLGHNSPSIECEPARVHELIDNALDAAEEVAMAPAIAFVVDRQGIDVSDNGPGLPPDTVKAILDFGVRVSSRAAYVSPTRGAQGNGLKTILTMPFDLDRDA